MEDLNSREYLDRVKRIVLENLRQTGGPPGVQMSGLSKISEPAEGIRILIYPSSCRSEIPKTPLDDIVDDRMDEDEADPDERRPRK